ncbi:hypothetical protein [uncultured Ramlibacter sp.]|uniref:hypothetical protein n=1 Tax=uncultured Ramlibacter sp. TaxID=260755 RepID=UPI0026174131|nr:hypothetical protein [uncultured Ramlibacter sp.]
MNKIRLAALAGAIATLTACASVPPATDTSTAGASPTAHVWNGGVWNSMIGYNGPSNSMDAGGGPN